ncbi:hypothetical protein D9615_001314 [Tricholomella constricta]|uniref:Uncharacterized protein n=1 Tax=Tricholomella constricta TaxID=117010 RepID=A0A8H5HKC9_9AGAR|nr:hypothetical protein D9615_001314 [Tricholomella constricta]
MTSRVQKGGPIFRPVVKSRARPDVRQSSVAAEASGVTQPATLPSLPSTSMPPPITMPSSSSSTSPINAPILDRLPPDSSSITSIITPGQPAMSMAPSIIASSSRSTPAPPTLMSRSTPVPMISRPSPSSITPSSAASLLSPHIQDSSNRGIAHHPLPSHPHILHDSGAENLPTSELLNTEAALEAQRTHSHKKSTTAVSDPIQELIDTDTNAEQVDLQPVTKRRKSRSESGPRAKRKRRATVNSDAEGSNIGSPEPGSKRKRRASSGTPRPRRSRGPSVPPYNPDADPGEEIDPTVVTMASLCSDTGQGRVSSKAAEILSNHAVWKTQNREKRARMKALMELKKYGREEEAEALEANSTPAEKTLEETADSGPSTSSAASPAIVDDTGSGFDYSQNLATSRYNVQVRIGPNGETIIDEESLVVDRTEAEDMTNYTHVVESDHTKFVNSGSYGKRYRGSRWSAEETELFYDALAQYGENYELIAYVLPGRDRKSCKNKFKAEDKKNPARINHCLNNNIPVDMVTLSRMTGKDFSGPVPEIRVRSPQPIVEGTTAAEEAPSQVDARKKAKKKSPDEGLYDVMWYYLRDSGGRADCKMAHKIVVCGAGFLGSSIARAVAASSWGHRTPQVQLSSRRPDKVHAVLKHSIPSDRLLPPVPLDVTKPATLPPAFSDADVVISLVGVIHGSPKDFEDIQLKGAENVATAAKYARAKLIHFSAIGADPQSTIPYARTKGLAETSILHICPDATIIRPSLVFGPDDDFFNRFSRLSKYLPCLPVFAGGKSRFQPVYVGDLARAVEILARGDPSVNSMAAGKIMEAGGPEIFTFKQLMELVLQYNNRYRPVISVPIQVGLLQGAIMEKLPRNLFTLTRAQVKQLELDNIVNPSPSADSISFKDFLEKHSGPLTSVHDILPTYL